MTVQVDELIVNGRRRSIVDVHAQRVQARVKLVDLLLGRAGSLTCAPAHG